MSSINNHNYNINDSNNTEKYYMLYEGSENNHEINKEGENEGSENNRLSSPDRYKGHISERVRYISEREAIRRVLLICKVTLITLMITLIILIIILIILIILITLIIIVLIIYICICIYNNPNMS